MVPEVKLRLGLVRELCKYYFNHKFTKAGLIVYSPCAAVCNVVFKTLLLMKRFDFTDLEMAGKLNSCFIPNVLSDQDWTDSDVFFVLNVLDSYTRE
ncbi:MAG: hypothetical protein QME06_08260 [Desulfobacterales bacterium]|nr:hypothetical protein [Desulfobacterales bacterium]